MGKPPLQPRATAYRWATVGDINAFFGLSLDNLADLVLAVSLLVIALVALRRGLAVASRLWTQRYIRRTISPS